MSVDYDWLQEMLDRYDSQEGSPFWRAGASLALDGRGTDMARELLRLRDGIEVIRDRCATLAKSAKNAGIRTLAREMDINAKALTGLLNGDTE